MSNKNKKDLFKAKCSFHEACFGQCITNSVNQSHVLYLG